MTTPKLLLVGLGTALLLLWARLGFTFSLLEATVIMALTNPQAMVQRDLLMHPVLLRKAAILSTAIGAYFLIRSLRE
ncbi:hypothetical protein [Deinococcus alpinitundrae]|uniref:hypothetical protein n=1 Tax=Deinococcus alpinitundrae TaxID=468913 RepID=UPI00137A0FFB|nr:hypothetical protein [Deinococcus alpinitundrae]